MFKTFQSIRWLQIFALTWSLCSLGLAHGTDTTDAQKSEEARLEFIGTIVYVPLEGGFYGIEADAQENQALKKYLPSHLTEAFQQEGLRVKVQAQLITGQMSFRMWGQMIDIISILPTDCEPEAPAEVKTSEAETNE